jgi:methyl-accepting chemotaxis protein
MFKDLKVGMKIALGFAGVLLLLLLVAGFSYSGLGSLVDGLEEYKREGDNAMLTGRIHANLLAAQLAAENYVHIQSESRLKEYEERSKQLGELIDEALTTIHNTERHKLIEDADNNYHEYTQIFSKVHALIDHRDDILTNQLHPNGIKMRKALTEIMESAHTDSDIEAAYFAGKAQETLLLSRLYVNKFMRSNALEDANRAKQELLLLNEKLIALSGHIQNAARRSLLKNAQNGYTAYTAAFTQIEKVIYEENGLIDNGLHKIGPRIAEDSEKVKLSYISDQKVLSEEMHDLATEVDITIIVVTVIAILIGILLTWLISRQITRPLNEAVEAALTISKGDLPAKLKVDSKDEVGMLIGSFNELIAYFTEMAVASERIADGDLAVRVEPKSAKDVLGNAFKKMIENLRNLVGKVQEGAEQVSAASEEISSGSQATAAGAQQIAQGAEKQSATVQQTSASVQQMNASIQQVSASTQQQSVSMQQVTAVIDDLSKALQEMAESASDVASSSAATLAEARKGGESINETVDSMKQIGQIVSLITDISEQINLLALNAAIEAARAGEHGRGFAVVAEGVTKLAERSQEAAKEITIIIEKGAQISDRAGEAMQKIMGSVESVTGLILSISDSTTEQAASSQQVKKSIEELNSMTEQITQAAEQQSRSSSEVVKAVNILSDISQQNASIAEESSSQAEESSSATEELTAQAQALQAAAATFRLN